MVSEWGCRIPEVASISFSMPCLEFNPLPGGGEQGAALRSFAACGPLSPVVDGGGGDGGCSHLREPVWVYVLVGLFVCVFVVQTIRFFEKIRPYL